MYKKASSIHRHMQGVTDLQQKTKRTKRTWWTRKYQSEALKWGTTNESAALQDFIAQSGCIVSDVNKTFTSGRLLFKPDGIITEMKGEPCRVLLEIKCPYKMKECKDLKFRFRTKKDMVTFCNESYHLNMEHLQGLKYFHQIQASLCAGDMCQALLVIWTPYDLLQVPVARDADWVDTYLNRTPVEHLCVD